MGDRELKCKDRIGKAWKDTLAEIRDLLKKEGEDGDPLLEYGLSFDYVAPGTFTGQRRGYFRWQLSWGGPSDEIRFYCEPGRYSWTLERAEYWFMDWFDGAKRNVKAGPAFETVSRVWDRFADFAPGEFEKATEG